MRLEHCLYGLFISLDFFGLFNHRKTFRFRFPILALLTKMYNQKLQIRVYLDRNYDRNENYFA